MKELYTALVKAQSAVNHAAKDSKNPHFKAAYSSLASVIDAVRPALSANGLAFVQKLHTADGGIAVETVILHESGQEMSCGVLFIPATKHDAQGYGSAISYAKRYSLQAAIGIASEDDDGNAASKPKPLPVATLDLDICVTKMLECETLDALQTAFASFYKIASPEQKVTLKTRYDEIKKEFE